MPLINPTPDFSSVAGVRLSLSYSSINHAKAKEKLKLKRVRYTTFIE